MPESRFNTDDLDCLKRWIVDPVVDRVSGMEKKISEQLEKHDARLTKVETGQAQENLDIGILRSQQEQETKDIADMKLEIGQWKKFRSRVIIVYGAISALAIFLWTFVKDKIVAYIRSGHH